MMYDFAVPRKNSYDDLKREKEKMDKYIAILESKIRVSSPGDLIRYRDDDDDYKIWLHTMNEGQSAKDKPLLERALEYRARLETKHGELCVTIPDWKACGNASNFRKNDNDCEGPAPVGNPFSGGLEKLRDSVWDVLEVEDSSNWAWKFRVRKETLYNDSSIDSSTLHLATINIDTGGDFIPEKGKYDYDGNSWAPQEILKWGYHMIYDKYWAKEAVRMYRYIFEIEMSNFGYTLPIYTTADNPTNNTNSTTSNETIVPTTLVPEPSSSSNSEEGNTIIEV